MVRNTQPVVEEIVCGYIMKGFHEALPDSDGLYCNFILAMEAGGGIEIRGLNGAAQDLKRTSHETHHPLVVQHGGCCNRMRTVTAGLSRTAFLYL
ncbi:MAG TPA: hypothetical protein PKN44_05745 [Bacteroidales bacterium]|nr:hypothetical protein [Bacteroidales bacterium]HPS50301.1 hypothetical protein [Bacteroidales bacterium]